MGFLGSLEKLAIIAYKDGEFKKKVDSLDVYINPADYKKWYRVCYNENVAQGSISGAPHFQRSKSETLEFDLVFDGTGVVPSPLPGVEPFTDDGIVKQVSKFLDLTYEVHGDTHAPYFLKLSWGNLLFKCRLTSFDITYTLFKPDGTPLRARAKTSFKEYISKLQQEKELKKNSPDLSHMVTVRAGDTLPLMCYGIYGSSSYYSQVAQVNGLTDFRQLVPGTKLLFPPLGEGLQ